MPPHPSGGRPLSFKTENEFPKVKQRQGLSASSPASPQPFQEGLYRVWLAKVELGKQTPSPHEFTGPEAGAHAPREAQPSTAAGLPCGCWEKCRSPLSHASRSEMTNFKFCPLLSLPVHTG